MATADRLNATLKFHCADHPTRYIEGVDLHNSDTKCIYCLVCILQTPQANDLYLSLQTFPLFLDSSAITFANEKAKVITVSHPPKEYHEIITKKTEHLTNLKNQLTHQKQQFEAATDEIKNVLVDRIERRKAEYFRSLDDHFNTYNQKYEELERAIHMCYPTQEDIDRFFPTRDELEIEFRRTRSTAEVDNFVKKVKYQLENNKHELGASFLSDELKKAKLDTLHNELLHLETVKRDFQAELDLVKSDVQENIEKQIQLDSEPSNSEKIASDPFPSGELQLTAEDYSIIKGWLPDQYANNFQPQLIYKGMRDGMTPDAFHNNCDGKGPTLTLIKGMFVGSNEMTVMGGFLDKDWNKKNSWISSTEAFIFSLTSQIKCPVTAPSRAAYGGANRGPAFGYGHDIMVAENLSKSYMNPQSYADSAKLVRSPSYSGANTINFTPFDIEVYTLSP